MKFQGERYSKVKRKAAGRMWTRAGRKPEGAGDVNAAEWRFGGKADDPEKQKRMGNAFM